MKKARIGSTLDSFLEEEGIKADVERLAEKKARNIGQEILDGLRDIKEGKR